MALSKPLRPGCETEMERRMREADQEDPNIEVHFTAERLASMSEYEKKRLRNIKRNYLVMSALGLDIKKPDFMLPRKTAPAIAPQKLVSKISSSESDSDVEWTPQPKATRGKGFSVLTKGTTTASNGSKHRTNQKSRDNSISKEPKKTPPSLAQFVPPTALPVTNKKKHDTPHKPLKGFTKDFVTQWTEFIDERISEKERMLQLCDSVKDIRELHAVDPFRLDYMDFYKKESQSADYSGVPRARYPRKNKQSVNYAELEMPDEDAFVYCEECDMEYLDQCPFHFGHFMKDTQNIDVALYGTDKYAESTLIDALEVRKSGIAGAGNGIWAKKFIPKYTIFGPYDGIVTKVESKARESGYSWLVYKQDKPHHFVDAHDKGHSNWMRWVNCAMFEEQQNLLAFQYKGDIFYRAIKDIQPNSELMVWYGDEYAEELGIFINDSTQSGNLPRLEGVWPCAECRKCFTAENHLAKHGHKTHGIPLPLHIVKNISNCNRESKQVLGDFAKLSLDNEHVTEAKQNNCLQNEFDGKVPSEISFSETQERTHTGDTPYQCQYCEKRFSQSSSCQTHERTHTGEKPYQCQYCEKRFSQSSSCQTHERTHTGEKPYQCQYCEKRFSRSSSCQTHERTHTGDTPYQCQYCEKRFSRSSNWQTHERTHTGERPYQCQYCEKRFSESSNCQTHERTHTGEKPYQCQYCEKRFSHSSSCQTHERTHTGEKPYQCQYCEKRFSRSSSCQTHERTHTGEKPYQCQYCEKRFSHSSSCQTHEKTHSLLSS